VDDEEPEPGPRRPQLTEETSEAGGEWATRRAASATTDASGVGEPDPTTDPSADDDDTGAGDDSSDAKATGAPTPPSRARSAAWAVTRAAVVLIVAAVGYQTVIPMHHVARSRLARLALTKPGLAAYDSAQTNGGEQSASQSGLAAIKTASAKSPDQTGLYSRDWQASQTSGAGLAVFFFPNAAEAQTGLGQLEGQQLSATAFRSSGLSRESTFTVVGVPGSTGSVYGIPKAPTQPTVALVAYRDGRTVVLDEVFTTTPTRVPASTLATNEYRHLASVLPGFSLKYTIYPAVATTLWAAGAVALAALAALAPAGWRWQRRRRQRRLDAELASRVVVGGQVIHKRRL
jgi:hypothetical protein